MKIKGGFILTEIGDGYAAVPVGETAEEFHGVIRLNDTGAFIWKALESGLTTDQAAQKLLKEYEGVDEQSAIAAVAKVTELLKDAGLLEEES